MLCAIPVFCGGIVIAFCLASARATKSEEMLRQWATKQGIRVVDFERPLFARGPFFWESSSQQAVFRITAEFPDGHIAHGWVLCGSVFLGPWSDEMIVKWDKETHEAPPSRQLGRHDDVAGRGHGPM